MPEQPRMFLAQSIARAERTTYEGPRYTPWESKGHSLPPAPDKPKKKRAVKHSSGDRGTGSRRTPEELETLKQSIAEGTAQGLTNRQLSDRLYVSLAYVQSLKARMRAQTKPQAEQLTPAPAPAPAPALTRQPEPARTHIHDWERRMAAWAFEGEPEKGKPQKARARKVSTGSDFRNVYPRPHMRENSTINPRPSRPVRAIDCAAPTQATRQDHAEQAEKARKTAELAIFGVGEGV